MTDVGARRRTDWRLVLCAWLLTLQISDIVTTKVALALSGNWEVNPAMAWCMANLGTLGWVAPKVALVALAVFALRDAPVTTGVCGVALRDDCRQQPLRDRTYVGHRRLTIRQGRQATRAAERQGTARQRALAIPSRSMDAVGDRWQAGGARSPSPAGWFEAARASASRACRADPMRRGGKAAVRR